MGRSRCRGNMIRSPYLKTGHYYGYSRYMPKLVKLPYSCPRCGYNTPLRCNMNSHLYTKLKTCQGLISSIVLTEEIKDEIMENRIYRAPAPFTPKPQRVAKPVPVPVPIPVEPHDEPQPEITVRKKKIYRKHFECWYGKLILDLRKVKQNASAAKILT